MSMSGVPRERVIVDMDCKKLVISGSRCDYLFVSEHRNNAWVIPIELKSGKFNVGKVRAQLQGGAQFAQTLLDNRDQFHFLPVLAHGGPIHPADMRKLRKVRIAMEGKIQQPKLIRCGAPLPIFQTSPSRADTRRSGS